MSFKTTGFAILVAAIAAGGGYAVWKSHGHDCCRAGDTSAAEQKVPRTGAPTPDDAALIAAQGYCPVMPDTKLGEMGAPFKVMVTGKDGGAQPVFLCCKGCQRKAIADPDKTLARVRELKVAVEK